MPWESFLWHLEIFQLQSDSPIEPNRARIVRRGSQRLSTMNHRMQYLYYCTHIRVQSKHTRTRTDYSLKRGREGQGHNTQDLHPERVDNSAGDTINIYIYTWSQPPHDPPQPSCQYSCAVFCPKMFSPRVRIYRYLRCVLHFMYMST